MNSNIKKIIAILLSVTLVFGGMTISFADDESGTIATSTDAPATSTDAEIYEIGDADPFRTTVTVNGDTSSERGFTWFTKTDVDSLLVINEAPDAKIVYRDVFEWEGNYCHKANVSGLEPGRTYTYTVGSKNVRSRTGRFVTDDADSKVNFIAIADVQASSDENFKKGADTARAAFRTMPDAEFIVNLGDFTNDSTNEEWDFYAKNFDEVNSGTTLVPVAGNHDGLGVWHWFENTFNLDTSESVQNLNGVNYSFDYGNAHFAVLNTNDVLSISLSQLRWLKNDMNSTDKDWKVVFMHKTPYTLGKDGKWPDALYLQRSLTAVCDMCDVDLVMSGHDHQYLRTKKLRTNMVSEDGTTYVLSGTAGSKRYEIRSFLKGLFLKESFIDALTIQKGGYGNYWNGSDWESTKEENVGGCFNCISIDGGSLTLNSYILSDEMVDGNGDKLITKHDSVTLTKETGKNKPSFSGDNTTTEAEFYLNVIPSFFMLATYTFAEWLPKFLVNLPNLLYVYITEDTF